VFQVASSNWKNKASLFRFLINRPFSISDLFVTILKSLPSWTIKLMYVLDSTIVSRSSLHRNMIYF
jgi:hypothetical protein